MLENYLLRLAGILISCLGAYVFWKPEIIANKVKMFYMEYPIIKYAGEKQLTSRNGFVRIVGALLFIIGIISLFSI